VTLKCLHDSIIVRRHTEAEMSKGGIILPNPQKEATGTVIAVGPKVDSVKAGEVVMYSPHAGQEFKHEGEMLTAIVDQDLFGVLESA
jgi:chaperonin GroES